MSLEDPNSYKRFKKRFLWDSGKWLISIEDIYQLSDNTSVKVLKEEFTDLKDIESDFTPYPIFIFKEPEDRNQIKLINEYSLNWNQQVFQKYLKESEKNNLNWLVKNWIQDPKVFLLSSVIGFHNYWLKFNYAKHNKNKFIQNFLRRYMIYLKLNLYTDIKSDIDLLNLFIFELILILHSITKKLYLNHLEYLGLLIEVISEFYDYFLFSETGIENEKNLFYE